MEAIVVVDYDSTWPELFETLRTPIWDAVADIALSVEHVGSTSVPGLAAKPVIDMDVIVPEAQVATGIVRLTDLGYEHRGDLGIPGREAFQRPTGAPVHNLYLCPSNSRALANHLAVRDYLRANADAARAYAELKRRLAPECAGDIDAYVRGKTNFLLSVLRAAGVSEHALAEIERVNL